MILLFPIFALANGRGGMRTSEACEVFSSGQMNCASKKNLAATALEGLKIRCLTDQAALCKDVKPEKMTTCKTTDICRDDASLVANILDGCKSAVEEYGREALESLKKKWHAYTTCNNDMGEKKKMFSSYNDRVPAILRREPLPDANLKDMNCSEVERVIFGYSENIQKKMLAKLIDFESKNPLLRGLPGRYPADLATFKTWMNANNEKDFESLKVTAKTIAALPAKAFGLLDQLGVNLSCYNAKARAEMVCYATLSVVEIAAETAVGAGALKALKYATLIADASGSTKVASTVMAMRKQEAVVNAGAKIESTSTRLVAKQKAKYLKAQEKALNMSEKLTTAEREWVAEIMVNDGKTLTLQQANGLGHAHDVGKSTGHGFHTYTKAELQEKFDILTRSGFSETQVRRLMRNGIAGEFATAAETAAASKKFDTRERDASRADSYTMLEDAGKVATRGGRALGTADDAAARIAIEYQINQLETLALRSKDLPGVIRQIDEVKAELLSLRGFGAREMAKVDTKALQAVKEDLEVKLKLKGYNGYSKIGPDGYTAEKQLSDAIEKELASRPEVAADKQRRLEQIQSEYKAGELKKQIDDRNAHADPAARPFSADVKATIQHDIELLNGDVTLLSKEDVARIRELKDRANASASWRGGGHSGQMLEDETLTTRFKDAWNSANEKLNRRRTSVEHLAASQGRTIKPKMVDQKSTVGSGPVVERVVSTRAASMAAEDSTKILDSLKAVQEGRFSPTAMAVEYKPVITSVSDLEVISGRLSSVGVTRRQLEAANAVSTLDVTMLGNAAGAYGDAKALLAVLRRDENLLRLTQQMPPAQAAQLKNLATTIQFYVDHDVPHHLDLGAFR